MTSGRRGWFGQSYRHYLAGRGIKSNVYQKRRSLTGISKRQQIIDKYREGFPDYYREDMRRYNPQLGRTWAKFRLRKKNEFDPKSFEKNDYGDKITVQAVPKGSMFPELQEVWLKRSSYWKKKTVLPMNVEKLEEGTVYPISPEEVDKLFKNMNPRDYKGIKGVEFVRPTEKQKGAWAQYVRSSKKIKIFSQPFKDGKVDGWDARQLNKHIKEYVIPHEVGHYKALRGGKTDKRLEVAEARADANVAKMDPFDKDVKRLVDGQEKA